MEILLFLCGIVALIGWIWTIVSAFQVGGILWGILNIIPIQPLIGAITFLLGKVDRKPVGIMGIGVFLGIIIRTILAR